MANVWNWLRPHSPVNAVGDGAAHVPEPNSDVYEAADLSYASHMHAVQHDDFQVLAADQYGQSTCASLLEGSDLSTKYKDQERTIRELKQRIKELNEEKDLLQDAHKQLQRQHNLLETELQQTKLEHRELQVKLLASDGDRVTEKARLETVVAEALGQKIDAVAKWKSEHETVIKLTEQLENEKMLASELQQSLLEQRELEKIWNTAQSDIENRFRTQLKEQDRRHNDSIHVLMGNFQSLSHKYAETLSAMLSHDPLAVDTTGELEGADVQQAHCGDCHDADMSQSESVHISQDAEDSSPSNASASNINDEAPRLPSRKRRRTGSRSTFSIVEDAASLPQSTSPEDAINILQHHQLGKLFKPLNGPAFDHSTLVALGELVKYFDDHDKSYKWTQRSDRYASFCIFAHVRKRKAKCWESIDDPKRNFACYYCVKKGLPCIRVDLATPGFMEKSQFWVLPIKDEGIYIRPQE